MEVKFTMYGPRQFVAAVTEVSAREYRWTLRRVGGGVLASGRERSAEDAVRAAKDDAQRIEVASHFA